MQHSVKSIGNTYKELSDLRKEDKRFNAEDFFNFAKANAKKYSLEENGNDLFVSTWHSDELIKDFQKTIKK